jgi:solute:Na+ symporter, SSS family
MTGLSVIDWGVIGVYFLGLIGVVWWSSKKQDTSEDYFLASRNIGWFVAGASLFASNIGSEHIVGLAGNGATSGMAMAHYELHAWIMILLGWVFVPFYYRSGVYTMPEFLERRFNAKARWILSVVSLVAYVFTKVSVTVYAGGIVFGALLPDTFGSPENAFWVGALATVVLTGIYTVFGGLRAVLYTDAAQAFILLIGSVFITYLGLEKLGGWGELKAICGNNVESFALWRPSDDPDFPWLGILIASPIVGIWYWCTDQYIVQRTLAAKNLQNARRATIWGGFLKVWPVLIFLVPGLIGYALHQKGLLQIPLDENGEIIGDQVFPVMVSQLLPVGLRGLVVGGLLAALMSSLSSLFNSCATLFTVDIYAKIDPAATEKKLVTVGRMATGIVVVLGILWIPVMPLISDGGLYKYLQSVQGYLAPPITAVFLLGLFFKRINGEGAVAGLLSGFVVGMLKLLLQALTSGAAGDRIVENGLLVYIGQYNFLYASGWLFLISIIIIVGVSLLTKKQDEESISGLTYATATEEDKKENRESWNKWDVIATCGVLGLVAAVYLYFSFWL